MNTPEPTPHMQNVNRRLRERADRVRRLDRGPVPPTIAPEPTPRAGMPAWDCITRDRLRAWIAKKRVPSYTAHLPLDQALGWKWALEDLEAFVNQGT